MYKLLVDCAVALADHAATISHAKLALQCMSAHLPPNHPSVALITLHMAAAVVAGASRQGPEQERAASKEASRLYRRAVRVLTVAYGEDHWETSKTVHLLNAMDLVAKAEE